MNDVANRERYLDLLVSALVNALYPELEAQLLHVVLCASNRRPVSLPDLVAARRNPDLLAALAAVKESGDTLALQGADDTGTVAVRPGLRNYVEHAHTMIGRQRLEHLRDCVATVLREGVPGDLIEAGVWRGGACVLMAGVLAAHGARDRSVFVADSFSGLRPPTAAPDLAYDMSVSLLPVLSVSQAEVEALFERYGLLDERVRFLPGWFADSLPAAPIGRLALLRIDGDYYESTRDALANLYPNVSPGGFVIVDDYQLLPPCRQAVDEYLGAHGGGIAVERVGTHAVYWRKP